MSDLSFVKLCMLLFYTVRNRARFKT